MTTADLMMHVCATVNVYFSYNLLSCFWVLSSLAILVFHILVSSEHSLVMPLKDLYYYGKLKRTSTSPSTHMFCSIPKSWFTHFYAAGFMVHSAVFALVLSPTLSRYTGIRDGIRWINWPCLQSGSDLQGLESNALPFLLVYSMEWLQISRRLYECVRVSHFSPGTMSFIHYFYGIFFYVSFGIGLLSSVNVNALDFKNWTSTGDFACMFVGLCVYSVASYFQHQSMITFADLRSGVKEKAADSHYIPRGHLFELVSCPHYLCEMLIYASFCLVFRGQNSFLLAVALFVWVTQLASGLLTHGWYVKTFPGYPQERRAVIPYLL